MNDRSASATEIPFQINDSGSISIRAKLNRTEDIKLMLHTGVDSTSLTKEATSRLNSLRWDSKEQVSSWGGDSESRFSSGNTLSIGDLTLSELVINEVSQAASGTDGKVGASQLTDALIEFDFDRSVIRILETVPPRLSNYQALPLTVEHGLLFVTLQLDIAGESLENKFMIHTGFGGTILLDDEFVREHELQSLLPELGSRELQDSYGNKIRTTQSKLDRIRIGSTELLNVPVELFDANLGRQKISVIGADALRRFNFVIDYERHVLLVPSESQTWDLSS